MVSQYFNLTLVLMLTFTLPGVSAVRKYQHGIELPTSRPLNIAHRGASGTLPEHTKEAYKRAIQNEADVIECDVAITKDGRLICRHDPWLSSSTDIEFHPEFADRKRTIEIDYYGSKKNVTEWFIFDFTLDEIKTLKAKQTNSERDPSFDGRYELATFEEYIEIANNAPRTIGIYPELKYPNWMNTLNLLNGTSFEQRLVDILTEHGYSKPTDPCFIQSFEFSSLQKLSKLTSLPLVMLVSTENEVSPVRVEQYSEICYGIGIWKCGIVDHYGENGYKNWIRNVSDVITRIHDSGMRLHVYTFRNENSNLAWDYHQDPVMEYQYYLDLAIDGFFTDFPATLDRFLDHVYNEYNSPDCDANSGSKEGLSLWCFFALILLGISPSCV